MKEKKGWLFCQGKYAYHEGSRTRLPNREFYLCRQETENPHWHRVFADGSIDWDILVPDEGIEKLEEL
jgi:hypothetical protein